MVGLNVRLLGHRALSLEVHDLVGVMCGGCDWNLASWCSGDGKVTDPLELVWSWIC